MSDIHALSGAYAIGALDDVEGARFQRHLDECPECQAEVESFREAAALLPETTLASPPAALRDRVLADIATVRPLPPRTAEATPSRRFRPAALVAAAAAVAVLAGGTAVWQPWSDDPTSEVAVSAIDQVLRAEDAQKYERTFGDGSKAVLTRSPSENGAVIQTVDMGLPPEGKVYELWLQHDDRMVPAGLMPRKGDAVVLLEGDPATADGFGITIEPEGGSEEPTGETVALIPFEQT